MTNIILVIIGILLAGVAALMMIFYGGDAFGESNAEAEAATLITQSSQINAAFDLYRAQTDSYPGDENGEGAMEELVENDYLSVVPHPPSGNNTYDRGWKVDYQRGIARSTLGDTDDRAASSVCAKAREQMGFTGNPKQCDDPSLTRLDPCCIMRASEL